MTKQEKHRIEKCNDLFDRELGAYRFKWKWGTDLEISMRSIDVDTGTMKYDYKANPQTGLVEALPIYTRRKACPAVVGLWVVCQFVPPCGESEFRAKFGTMLEYPRNGVWNPIKDSALKPGILPSKETTEFCIKGIRAHFAEFDKALEDSIKQQEIDEITGKLNRKYKFKDEMPAFGVIPGKKSTVSFGGMDLPSELPASLNSNAFGA